MGGENMATTERMIEARREVSRFAEGMEDRLKEKDHLFPNGWVGDDPSFLLGEAWKRMADLNTAFIDAERYGYQEFVEKIRTKAFDTSNFLMMVVDNIGGFDA